jgi:hypothetical protein
MSVTDQNREPEGEEDLDRPPPVEGGAIEGRVTDFDGVPLVGVRVEAAVTGGGDLDLLPTLTDGEGRFRLEGLAEGAYDLRFALGKVAARTLAVPPGTRDLAVKLARPQGVLLLIKTERAALPPVVVHVLLERRRAGGRVREYVGRHLQTRLLLWSIRPGTYRITVWGGPYLPVTVDGVDVHDGRPAPEVQVLLGAPGGAIRGQVRGEVGADASRIRVAWRRLDGEEPWPRTATCTLCDAEGRFRIQGLPGGRYRVSAGTPDGPLGESEVEVREDAEQDLSLAL